MCFIICARLQRFGFYLLFNLIQTIRSEVEQDNNPKHSDKAIQEFKRLNGSVLDCSSPSPELSLTQRGIDLLKPPKPVERHIEKTEMCLLHLKLKHWMFAHIHNLVYLLKMIYMFVTPVLDYLLLTIYYCFLFISISIYMHI